LAHARHGCLQVHPQALKIGSVARYVGEDFLFVVDVVIAAHIGDGQFDLAADERAGGGAVSGNAEPMSCATDRPSPVREKLP
jgi:hypothetical protein